MFGIADYGAFVAAILIFLAIPGPGNLALITSTGKGGIVGGLAATFGVIAGDQVLMWAAVAGVATGVGFSIMMAATPSRLSSGATVIGCRMMRRAIGCAARSRPAPMPSSWLLPLPTTRPTSTST